MYQIKINESIFEIEPDDELFSFVKLNGKPIDLDIEEFSNGTYSVIKEKKTYNVQVLKSNYKEKTFVIKVNGTRYIVNAKDQYDIILKNLGLSAASETSVKALTAPMPGKVLELLIKPGSSIKKNDPLIILEAMKMENILKASSDGIIESIKVKIGDSVEKNEVLISFK